MDTSIGIFLKKLRREHKENLKIMAEKLGVSSAFLSAVEHGKKKFPRSWFCKLSEIYALDDVQYAKLTQATMEDAGKIEINIEKFPPVVRKMIIDIARNIEGLDNTIGETMIDCLNNMAVNLIAMCKEENKKH